MEFNTNTGNFFMSDKALSELFGVSEKTISRTLKALEDRGFIKRETKNIKGGKERHITINTQKIEETLTTDKMTIDKSHNGQNDFCITDKMTFDNGQNDLIKNNTK